MDLLTEKKIVIIGGTSGIGLATAKMAAEKGAHLVVTGLKQNIEKVKKEISGKVESFHLDISNESAVKEFFHQIGPFDYLTTPGSVMPTGSFLTMDLEIARQGIESKFLGQYNAAKYGAPKIRKGGSIVLFSGVVSQRPQKNLVLMASVNSAVEGLARGLAIELSPIRVNCIAPGIVDTPRYDRMQPDAKKAMYEQLSNKLPVGHIGQPEELAQAVLMLMTNTFLTGQTLFVDGGHQLV